MVCVYTHVLYTCVHVCGHVCTHACGDRMLMLGVFLKYFLSCVLRQGLSLIMELTDLTRSTSQAAPGSPISTYPKLGLGTHAAMAHFSQGCGGQSSGPHACRANA